MRHTFSIGDRSGPQAGQSNTRTLCLRSHTFATCAEWGLALSCWNRHEVPGKNHCLGDQHISLQNSNITLCINGTFTYIQIAHAMGTNAPPYHHRGCFFHFQSGWSFSSSAHRIRCPFFPKNKLKCGLVLPENTFPLSLGPSQMTSGPKKSAAFLHKCGYVNDGSMTVSQTILPEGSMVTRIQQGFPPLVFTDGDFPWLPESFHDIMNCGWWKTLSFPTFFEFVAGVTFSFFVFVLKKYN